MKQRNEYGQFFPTAHSPHAYNETVAQQHHPLNEQEALARGYAWRSRDEANYRPQTYSGSFEIKSVADSITNEILACIECKKNFKIIPQELVFYRRMEINIPNKCPDCRYRERMSLRNPHRLWSRSCQKCGGSIETTFAPERPEMVYCEKCYVESI